MPNVFVLKTQRRFKLWFSYQSWQLSWLIADYLGSNSCQKVWTRIRSWSWVGYNELDWRREYFAKGSFTLSLTCCNVRIQLLCLWWMNSRFTLKWFKNLSCTKYILNLKFCHSGEILPNLVTLLTIVLPPKKRMLFKSFRCELFY